MLNKNGEHTETRPWQTKEWAEMRERLIGDKCEQCGSEKPPMVLHHADPSIQNPRYWDIKHSVTEYYFREYCKTLDMNDFYYDSGKRKYRCPHCNRAGISERKIKKPKWRCSPCGSEFSIAVIETVLSPIPGKWKGCFDSWVSDPENEKKIEDESKRIYDEKMEIYMSGEGTKTFCKKCAFLWDKKGKDLCPECKENYKFFMYEICYTCYQKTDKYKEWKKRDEGYAKYCREMDEIEKKYGLEVDNGD